MDSGDSAAKLRFILTAEMREERLAISLSIFKTKLMTNARLTGEATDISGAARIEDTRTRTDTVSAHRSKL